MSDVDVRLDGNHLTLEQVHAASHRLAGKGRRGAVIERMKAARELVDKIAAGDEPVYGINTGFGALAEVPIPADKVKELQRNLILSHAVGVGEPLQFEIARALMLLRANTLAVGHSGCRPIVLEQLVSLLNIGAAPFVPKKGSVGASGDLAPLAHVALLLLGEGPALLDGEKTTADAVLEKAGLTPLVLEAKEGLALINGTQAMAASGIHSLLRAERLCRQADIIGALSLDALKGTNKAFDPRIHAVRPHAGQQLVAKNLRALLEGSDLLMSHQDCGKVQDPYSLRCMPQVHGATRDALSYVRGVLEREVNSATDNPLVFLKGDGGLQTDEVISGGNFHGQPLALALDFAAIALAEIANISERRIEQLVNPALSSGLPAFLAPEPGLNSGFMILQVTAASLINENKVLSHPASTDSIPSSANREDHVSMGMTAANKLSHVVDNVRRVLGIELLCACQAVDLRGLTSGPGLDRVFKKVRERVPFAPCDRAFAADCEQADALMCTDVLLDEIAAAGLSIQ
jgi:histidine ammonia-lyase